ncbi:hypothetical protein LIER_26131 [Lithospermum erythrorhizon]|uniref:Reverse transcriptase Ty1/copia-type domain-containing protein n=1 Tax=Lithospermum erythrorhizon TaxID=34254 RepID=A0AAV3RBL0_LITER
MEAKFEMSMVRELKYLLGFQINQTKDSIFISQAKYAKNMVKKFGMETSKAKRTPFATHVNVIKDEDVDVPVLEYDWESTLPNYKQTRYSPFSWVMCKISS